jgi:RNA polymerase sigma-70 factor (ECF subfamily)
MSVADATELAAVFEAIGPGLRRFLLGVTKDLHAAEDAAQAAFARAMEARPEGSPEALKAWFFKVALNEALARRRGEKRFREVARDLSWLREGIVETGPRIENRETAERIRDELERLPKEQRLVVYKRLIEEKKFAEIARDEKLPLGTVLTRMRLALERLRASLGDLK